MHQGTKVGGFIAGFFFGCIGAILVQIFAKSPVTKQWAWIGFGVAIVLSIITSASLTVFSG